MSASFLSVRSYLYYCSFFDIIRFINFNFYFEIDGKERRWIDDTEILAINAYGVSLGLTDDRKKN